MRKEIAAVFAAILLGILPTMAQDEAATTKSVWVDLRLEEASGCYISEDGAGLWSSLVDPAATIHLEAEQAEKLTLQEGRQIEEDLSCSGGACVAFITRAEFPLAVSKSGTYQVWARAFLPRAGSWTHLESMGESKPKWIRDSSTGVFGRWFWSKLDKYDLATGKHRFILHNWLGGAKLDTLLFTCDEDFSPLGLRGAPAAVGTPGTGTITTGMVAPSGVAGLVRLQLDRDLNGGSVTAEISLDDGRNWASADSPENLGDLRTAADGTDHLKVKFTIQAATDGKSPVLRHARLHYRLNLNAETVLENDHYRIAVARGSGKLCGIFNKALGISATPAHLQEPLVGLVVREPGAPQQTVLSPEDIEFERCHLQGQRIILSYSALAKQIRLTIEMVADDSPICKWTCKVENRSRKEIIRVDFPLIGGAAIGNPEDDECVLPHTGGKRIKNPSQDKRHATTYLGGGSMSWIDLCDKRAGLYVAMQDRQLTSTEMACEPSTRADGADLSFRTHTIIKPGQTKTRDFVVGVHRGDWHWAADRYREWAYSWMRHPDDPDWIKTCDGWIHANGRTPFDGMTGRLERAQQEGLGYIQYWGQMTDGLDQCCGNFYWPAPALGGPDGFKRGVADLHRRGGRITGYMNCQTWTRDSPINNALRRTPKSDLPREALDLIHPLSWFEKNRLYQLDGTAQGYYADTLGWYIMCPASTGFREHLRFWIVDMYCKRYGTDGVYIDQAGATAAKPCYNLDHGHDDIGHWGMGNVQLLKTCVEQARAHNPDFIIAIEGAGDALGQYASLHLLSGLCTHPEVYHYTFPEHILISGFSNGSHLTSAQRITRAFLNGDRFDMRLNHRSSQSAIQLRKRIKRWLYPARFMDTVGLRISDERVLARWNLCTQPGKRALLVTIDNEHQVSGARCTLKLPADLGAPISLHVFDREGGVRAEKPEIVNGELSFTVPSSTLSAGLALYESPPDDPIDAWCAVKTGPTGSDTVALSAANYLRTPVVVKTVIRTTPPLKLESGPTEVQLPAGGSGQWKLKIANIDKLMLPTQVVLDFSWP
ncbi:MAG: hypothetical protein KAI66_23455, partial [Lentisphaeria bacterium]|nr:hypothetical protein [Lentisphaeria bacterium]